MSPKIFVGDVRCLAMSPNKCARALYGCFKTSSTSCLLTQCDISRLLRFRVARFDPTVGSYVFFKNLVVLVGFLYNVSIVICHLFSLTFKSVIICVC